MTGGWGLVLRFLNNWHVSQLPNQVRSEELGVNVRRKKLGSAAEFYINDGQTILYNKGVLEGGIGALYESCAPSSTPHSSLLTKSRS